MQGNASSANYIPSSATIAVSCAVGDTLRTAMVVALGIGTTAAAVCHESLGEMVSTFFHTAEDAAVESVQPGIELLNP